MSKSSKSNSSGKKKNKTNRLKTKNNGNVGEAKDKEELLEDTDVSAKLAIGKISDSDSRDNDTVPESKINEAKSIIDDKSVRITPLHNPDIAMKNVSETEKESSMNNDSGIVHLPVSESFNTLTNPLSVKSSVNNLFISIYNGEVVLTLPNRAWSVHCTNMPQRCIVISEAVVKYNSETGLVPTYTKQIIFDEKMNYELFLLNSKAVKPKSHNVDTIADVTSIITYTNNLKLCNGGPEVSIYCNINPECAYRDYNERWRHNLCTLEVSESDTCESCLSLDEILRRHAQRSKQAVKSKPFVGYGKRKRVCQ